MIMKKAFVFLVLTMAFSYGLKAQDSFDPDVLLGDARTLILDGKYIEGFLNIQIMRIF